MDSRDIRPLVIVDDDAQCAKLLARLLRLDGLEAEVTTDGAAALARLTTREPVPDVLVTDFHLPHADGLAIGKHARSRRGAIPIFIVTGDPESVASALVADPLTEPVIRVTKPLVYSELLAQLTAELDVDAAV